MATLMASNNVGEDRRSDRAASLSYVMRPFSGVAAEKVNKVHKQKDKKEIERVEGQQRVAMFADHHDSMNLHAKKSRLTVGSSQCQRLTEYLEGDSNRSRKDTQVCRGNQQATQEK